MNVLMMGLVRPSRANLATRMAEKAEAGIPNALSNICTVKGATLVPAAVEVTIKPFQQMNRGLIRGMEAFPGSLSKVTYLIIQTIQTPFHLKYD